MNFSLATSFAAAVSAATIWLGLLWVAGRRGTHGSNWSLKAGLGVATILILMVPVDGLRLGSWAFSVCPNPSLPLLGLVGAGLWQRLFGVSLFKAADWQAAWRFGAVAGTVLYLHSMIFGAVDLYYWGWNREGAWAISGLAVAFLACGNRLGVLLLLALLGVAFDALESTNCWDYVIDPFFWLASVGVLVTQALRYGRLRYRRVRPFPAALTVRTRDQTVPWCPVTPPGPEGRSGLIDGDLVRER